MKNKAWFKIISYFRDSGERSESSYRVRVGSLPGTGDDSHSCEDPEWTQIKRIRSSLSRPVLLKTASLSQGIRTVRCTVCEQSSKHCTTGLYNLTLPVLTTYHVTPSGQPITPCAQSTPHAARSKMGKVVVICGACLKCSQCHISFIDEEFEGSVYVQNQSQRRDSISVTGCKLHYFR